MAGLPFVKMQGIGNDFVVVDQAAWPDADWPDAAIRLCHRRFGIGGDGLLVLEKSDIADIRMRMFNPDGTEDMCGNGLRCIVRFAKETGRIATDSTVETIAGIRSVRLRGKSVTAEMGRPAFAPASLPMIAEGDRVVDFPLPVGDEALPVTVVSTGTTHTIVFVETLPDDARFLRLSPLIENHLLFPERTSVMWTVVEGDHSLRLRIWERGAGETLGCGTGACAAAVAAQLQGKVASGETTVRSQGGALDIRWENSPDAPLWMTGPAEVVFRGVIDAI